MDEERAVDERHLPVLASEARPIEPVQPAQLAAPAAAAAVGGVLAGIVTFVLVRGLRGRPGRRGLFRRRKSGPERALEIATSRSFLVDVHVVKR
jgi:hypothetical protein